MFYKYRITPVSISPKFVRNLLSGKLWVVNEVNNILSVTLRKGHSRKENVM